jgi:uncharacterized damage-inducible protein DinB
MAESPAQSQLGRVVKSDFSRCFLHLASRVDRAVHSLPEDKLWVKPFAYGNSVGHLVLHLTGNLNHYVGTLIAGTGYVRDRPREFTETDHPAAAELLKRFHEAIALVVRSLESLDDQSLTQPITDQLPIETRLGLFLVCAAHLNNHVGQMSYLVQAQGHSTQEPPIW